jgi:hypothetical protein
MLTSHELLGFMSPTLAMEILTFAFESDKQAYRTTLAAVAEARHVRPVFLERQPRAQRHTAMLATLTRPALEPAAMNLLRTWLLKKHKAMLVDFLNSLGIEHSEGVVENLPAGVEDEKLKAAVEALLSKYPHEAVSVYLHAFNDMNDANWAGLKKLLETDTRLQLGSHS